MKPMTVMRALLVFLVAVPALTPRGARSVAATGLHMYAVADGARNLLVSPPTNHGVCSKPYLWCRSVASFAAAHMLVGLARLPDTASAAITPAPRPDQGAVCGAVPVPLDRVQPANGTIQISFELFTHSGPGPAQSTILVNPGGPGAGTVANSGSFLFFFGQNLDVHDLLLIDDRERGLSATINCAPLQHGTEPFAQADA